MLQYCLYDLVTATTRKESAEKQTSQTTNLYICMAQTRNRMATWLGRHNFYRGSATFSFSELFYRAKSQFDGDPPSYENSWTFLSTVHCNFYAQVFYLCSTYTCCFCILFSFIKHLRTRGQWPYRPAATMAMRNRHVMLYDNNYLSKYITPNSLGGHLTSDLK